MSLRFLSLAFAGTVAAASPAAANPTVEVGAGAGIHGFSDTNELGVIDEMGVSELSNSPLVTLRLGVFFNDLVGVEGEFGILPTSASGDLNPMSFDVTNLTYRAHLVLEYGKPKLAPFLVAGVGAFHVVSTDDATIPTGVYTDTDTAWYTGAGVKYRFKDNGFGLRGDVRLLFPPSSADDGATLDFEALLSFYKEFNRGKSVDRDPDRDGILNPSDRCPTDPEDKDQFEDADGCPEADNDKDDVLDVSDKCPVVPEDKDQFEDTDGCPDLDNDKDTIADTDDSCKNDPEDKDGFEDTDGCPDTDNDKDNIVDAKDKCINDPETVNSFEDDDGCPDTVPIAVKKFTGVIEGITFQTAKAEILAVSNAKLDEAVKVLTEYPTLKIEIQGHTDDQIMMPGSPFADNQALSVARAEAVKAHLVKKGIAEDRLVAKGFGDSQPVVPTTGADGKPLTGAALNNARAKNRRVEFHPIP